MQAWRRTYGIDRGEQSNEGETWVMMRELSERIEANAEYYRNHECEFMHSVMSPDEFDRRSNAVIRELRKAYALYAMTIMDRIDW